MRQALREPEGRRGGVLCEGSSRPRLHASRLPTSQHFNRISVYDKYSGATKFTTHLDHISHCKTTSGATRSKRWTHRAFLKNTHRDCVADLSGQWQEWLKSAVAHVHQCPIRYYGLYCFAMTRVLRVLRIPSVSIIRNTLPTVGYEVPRDLWGVKRWRDQPRNLTRV